MRGRVVTHEATRRYRPGMGGFITGTHHCPDCHEAHTDARVFMEQCAEGGGLISWCAFMCPNGHWWARPREQAAK